MWYRYIFEAPFLFFHAFPIYHVIAILLLILQALHIFWTYLIYKVIFEALKGNIEVNVCFISYVFLSKCYLLQDADDIRSSSDEFGEDN